MGSSQYPPIPPPGGGKPNLPGQGQPLPLRPDEYGPTAKPVVTSFTFDGIPPNGLYVTRNDVLYITVQNSQANFVGLDLHYRLQLASPTSTVPGQPDTPATAPHNPATRSNTTLAITQTFIPPSNRSFTQYTQPLDEGFLTNLSVGFSPGFAKKGQCYVKVILQRGDSFTGGQSGQLVCGYVTGFTGINWPGPSPNYSVDGAGWLNSVQQGNPAAWADFAFTVPASARWRIRSISAGYFIANSGSARLIHAVIKDASGNQVYQAGPNNAANINQNTVVCLAPNISMGAADTQTFNIPIPADSTLPAGFTIGTSTSGIQVGDQYSSIWALVEEWSEF